MSAKPTRLLRQRRFRAAVTGLLACAMASAGTPLYAGGCPSDFNGDGDIDSADLGILLSAWGTRSADLNGDGVTDGADLGLLLGSWGPCPSTCSEYTSMSFTRDVVTVRAGAFEYDLVLEGSVAMTSFGDASGMVTVMLPDGEAAVIDFTSSDGPSISVSGITITLAPSLSDWEVLLDGSPTPVPAILDHYLQDASGGAPVGSWSPEARASLALAALASTPEWQCNVEALTAVSPFDGGVAAGWGCKLAAYAAATVIAGLAGAGCAVLTGGCAIGTTVTIGGFAVPCVVLIGLCAGGAFAGTAAAYEAVLALCE